MEISAKDAVLVSLIAELQVYGETDKAKKMIKGISDATVKQVALYICEMLPAKKQLKKRSKTKNESCRYRTDNESLKKIAVGYMNWAYLRMYPDNRWKHHDGIY